MDRKHIHGGLINCFNSPHVIVAVQALLHSSLTVDFVLSDDGHYMSCQSLGQCMMCSLRRIYKEMSDSGIGDPTSVVLKWQGISSRMIEEDKKDPLKVLQIFVDIMKVQHIGRYPGHSAGDLFQHHLSKTWKYIPTREMSCPSCGQFESSASFDLIELHNVSDLTSSILNFLTACREETCPRCKTHLAKCTYVEVDLPQCATISIDKCAKDFKLPFELNLHENKFCLRSMIVQPEGKSCFFVGICPDGHFRKFEDSRISTISPARICMPDFTQHSKITLIFDRTREKKLPPKAKLPKSSTARKSKGSDRVKVVSFPDLSALDLTDSSSCLETTFETTLETTLDTTLEHETSNNAAPTFKDASTQTGPFASFEFCKESDKFQFFTGRSVEEFNALFDLIGGDDVISRLKLNYRLDTPKKKQPTYLSSEDKLFLFLLRLRRGLPLEELSVIFNMSVSMVGEICYVMTRLIYLTFKGMEDDMFPTAEAQRVYKPKVMWPFPKLRVLLDGVSFFIQTPSNFEQQGNTFSLYKKHNVVIFSIGIACNGATIFCSDGMEGCMSDKEVIIKSGLLQKLSKGDGVMTDRGYELTAELQEIGSVLYKPPSKESKKVPKKATKKVSKESQNVSADDEITDNLTAEEEILTKAIASARIYTEHAIADIKDNRLLQGTIPLTLLPVLGDLVYIAAYLRNFNSCRIHDKRYVIEEKGEEEKGVGENPQEKPDDPGGF